MRIKSISLLMFTLFPLLASAKEVSVARYTVAFPGGEHVSYSGAFAKNFPHGLPLGIGAKT